MSDANDTNSRRDRAKRLVDARELRGLIQSKLADKAGLPAATVCRLEKCARGGDVETWAALANALDVSLDWLWSGNGRGPSGAGSGTDRLRPKPPKKSRARSLLGAHPPGGPSAQAG